jgi:alpha-amylase
MGICELLLVEICLVFEVHQPYRINRKFRLEEAARAGTGPELFDLYFDNRLNREVFERAASKCYLPASDIILNAIEGHRREGRPFKVAYSFSGVFLEQCRQWCPQLLDLLKELVKTGCVELLSQTYFHSLSSIYYDNLEEFKEQVRQHVSLVGDLAGARPRVFENTELIYNNLIARAVSELGFSGIVTEGSPKILEGRSPHQVYHAKDLPALKVLLRDYSLSDDIAFRFSARWWEHYPLTADKYAQWVARIAEPLVLIFIDYETFGEHHWPESGIHDFLRALPDEMLKHDQVRISAPSELIARIPSMGEVDVFEQGRTISWADTARDLSPWLGNEFQRSSFNAVRLLGGDIPGGYLKGLWRYLQISDHYYYMYTGFGGPADVHSYFAGPLGSPSDVYVAFSNIVMDLSIRAAKARNLASAVKSEVEGMTDHPFRFWIDERTPLDLSARGLREFGKAISKVDRRSIEYHCKRGDFASWARGFGDPRLAWMFSSLGVRLRGEALRRALKRVLIKRIDELKAVTAEGSKVYRSKKLTDDGP